MTTNKRNNRLRWFAVCTSALGIFFFIISTFGFLFWNQLAENEQFLLFGIFKDYLGYILIVFFILGIGFILAMDELFKTYIFPIKKIVEEIYIISSVNPSRRISINGNRDILELVKAVNYAAERFEKVNKQVHEKIECAKSKEFEEKRLLAAIIDQMPQGILLCNPDGLILLYNKQARYLLTRDDSCVCDTQTIKFMGLGRSVFRLIEKKVIVNAIDEINEKLTNKQTRISSSFVIKTGSENSLNVQVSPVLNLEKKITGFILILENKTPESIKTTETVLKNLTQNTRNTPDPFKQSIHKETTALYNMIDGTLADYSQYLPEISGILPENCPIYYDFDLFTQAGQIPKLDDALLTDLSYTVFDCETTGLSPKGGDEIISIGAVRIVNQKIITQEGFEQLIDPKRSVPHESIMIHKIQPEMLEGQPTIEKVLPIFHRYTGGTVLVGHNVAFDMRMLELKQEKTGVKFVNPVLDTLLLSAVVHQTHDKHNLENIAKRLGVSIVGRHTALGDAIVTAELFLKLIPLLNKNNIYTLKQARMASQKTYYARLKYN